VCLGKILHLHLIRYEERTYHVETNAMQLIHRNTFEVEAFMKQEVVNLLKQHGEELMAITDYDLELLLLFESDRTLLILVSTYFG
jgi:N-dimethylarginine dimethylaminohydrolase